VNLSTSSIVNGSGGRKCESWIERFVDHTDNLDAPHIFRQWAAISAIGAALEQKVWITTSSPIFPNLYVVLIGHPGTGKTRTIRMAKQMLAEVPEFHIAPVSFTFASLVDVLTRCKRVIMRMPDAQLEYNTVAIIADELGTFMHKFDKEMADGISAFYDPDPYGHERRGGDIKIKIKSPQLSILCGSTPSNLMDTMPESAWGQGLTSRMVMVFSDERIVGDDFAKINRSLPPDLVHDLRVINSQVGEFKVTKDYITLVNAWRQLGEAPAPNHPKLIHYNSRRRVNLYKLSMISAIDKGNTLLLTREDFNRAMNWLVQAESNMPDIFKAGASGTDGKATEEILHYIMVAGPTGLSEQKVVNFARERVPIHSVMRVIEVMERSGMIEGSQPDKTGQRRWRAVVESKAP